MGRHTSSRRQLCGWAPSWRAAAADEVAVTEAAVVALRDAVLDLGGLVASIAAPGPPAVGDDGGAPPPVLGADVHLESPGLDAFHGTPLDDVLRRSGRTHLLIAGHGLEGPVHSTMRSANDRGYECLLVADAASAGDPTLRRSAVSQVEMSGGIFGAVGSLDHVLTALSTPKEST